MGTCPLGYKIKPKNKLSCLVHTKITKWEAYGNVRGTFCVCWARSQIDWAVWL